MVKATALGAALGLVAFAQDGEAERLRNRQAELLDYLLSRQKEEGTWRTSEKVPTRLASQTLLICQALMDARDDSNRERIDPAVEKALAYCLDEIKVKRDWRIVWDHILGVPVYRRAKELGLLKGREQELEEAIRFSLRKLERGQGRAGSWSYTDLTGGIHTSFVTSSAAYWLIEAKEAGGKVEQAMIDRAVSMIESMRLEDGAFAYYHPIRKNKEGGRASFDKMPGSIARNALCELVLLRAGRGSKVRVGQALENFMTHYGELEENYLKFPGTHDGPYQIAPYYFFYGHYTTALAAVEGAQDAALRKRALGFIRSKLIGLEIARYNKDHHNIGFDTFHAIAYTLMALRLTEKAGQ
jgi:hypothetical protein